MIVCGVIRLTYGRKLFLLILFLVLSLVPRIVSAETIVLQKTYSHRAGKIDTKASSLTIASGKMKGLLLQDLAAHLEDKTDLGKSGLGTKQIATLAAGLVTARFLWCWDKSMLIRTNSFEPWKP
jgi:hypothetical protein